MKNLSRRAITGVVVLCAFFVAALLAVGLAGVFGVQADHRLAEDVARDELSSSAATARVSQMLDHAYAGGQAVLLAAPAERTALATTLYDRLIPSVESSMSSLVALHEGDDAAEKAVIAGFVGKWRRLRADLTAIVLPSRAPTAAHLAATFQPLSAQIEQLTAREERDASTQAAAAAHTARLTELVIIATIGVSLLVVAAMAGLVAWRLRRASDPAAEQAAFADTLQLARDETEAHVLLQRHVERAAPDTRATVLNRNNSADRLEAMTPLDADSPLQSTLAHAEPSSCLAVRSGRLHRANAKDDALLACSVCSSCPGSTLCLPLTVGGEVIGSVLANRTGDISTADERQIRDSVSQAAPVLANLRNLAIAETRASTDSLTGLANKRAIENQLKQMVAHATRSGVPLSVLLLDLDHFKQINDRLGHPVGDTTLANVGAALRATLREGDVAGRSGGEEFLVLLPGTDQRAAADVAERIRASIAGIDVPGNDGPVSASVGVATCPEHASTAERLVRLADSALYLAKRTGRDRTEVATSDRAPRAGTGGHAGHLVPVAQDRIPD